jgi:hypothetical protein
VPFPAPKRHIPFFSPDDQWIGFSGDRGLNMVAVAGGDVSPIARGRMESASWDADDWIVFRRIGPAGDSLRRVPGNGGEPAQMLAVPAAEGRLIHLHGPADGRVLFTWFRPRTGRLSRSCSVMARGRPIADAWTGSHTDGMVIHMKTTLTIDDTVMARLKRESARTGRTMSELVELALRQLLQAKPDPVDLSPLPSFSSGGALVDIADREALYGAMEGR